ncbi:lysylphosphatidylglycerol synthase transmembrane domain-containing protein [Streptomyces sp. DSM 44917]|uniref:Lysylphosphatidylglycerol synthase transmembrane domain-containing protein n=1 Tax=Streptomyces boetiae TaxID=3075541 RepID=A0ABU2L7X5_9ACTN|nr:lysylphosphatidylglycerol synthase transmembrane domain-containing protein [Streptomyces sp. DSM 44917]MDT0307671.1 lysylphosphatidylglycerol synthase transmembrane domain-containing protein [Streptomyces sp. DSM 44917]
MPLSSQRGGELVGSSSARRIPRKRPVIRGEEERAQRPDEHVPAAERQGAAPAAATPPTTGRPARPAVSPGRAPGQDGADGGVPAAGGADGAPQRDGAVRIGGDEPILAARVHRPADLLRVLLGLLGIGLVLGLAIFAIGTTEGIERDVDKGASQAPSLLIEFAGFLSAAAVLVVPVAFAIERVMKRDGLRIADGVLAAVLAHGVSLTFSLWVARLSPDSVQDALTRQAPNGGGLTDPVHGYLAPVIAYATAVGMTHRPRWRPAMWAVLVLDAVAVLVAGYTTPFSILVTVLIGWTIAYATLYAVGSPNVRPTGQQLLAGLRHLGFRPVSALRAEGPEAEAAEPGGGEGTERRERTEPTRHYVVTLESGPPLDVTVVDRAQQARGFFYRAWRRLALRGSVTRRSLPSLRQALEQEALLAYAAIAAGANAPKLIATSELGPDAVMLVYEHIGGRNLDSLPEDEITDELMRAAWGQVGALQSRRIAHRRLDGRSLLVDREGRVYLTDLRSGEIAAGDLLLRMDVAQLLTTFGLRAGAERAVACAVAVLGPDAVADSLPLLQPIALSRPTRAALRLRSRERAGRERQAVLDASRAYREARGSLPENADRRAVRAFKQAEKQAMEEALDDAREPDLLALIRQQVLLIRPQAAIEPARIERIRPRTLVTVVAAAFAAYLLVSQLINPEFQRVWDDANWGWVLVAAGFSALTYFAAAISLLGFVPEKVGYLRTVAAQVAGSFVKLVAPAAIGGAALNARYLQRQGLRPGHAVASVGASQLFGLAAHIALLLTFGYLTGTEQAPSISPSRTVIAGLLTAAVAVLIVTAVPVLRKNLSERVRSLFAGVVPRMLDVVQRPRKLVAGIGGMLLMTMGFVLCLDSSLRAFGAPDLSLAAVAVVFLAGNAVGSAVPTPGGLGAIELALSTALITLHGVPSNTALGAVLLFRLLTFWLPVLPGWLAFTQLTRRGHL